MSEATVELIFWIIVFFVFFFGFRRLQRRKRARQGTPPVSREEAEKRRLERQLEGNSNDGEAD